MTVTQPTATAVAMHANANLIDAVDLCAGAKSRLLIDLRDPRVAQLDAREPPVHRV